MKTNILEHKLLLFSILLCLIVSFNGCSNDEGSDGDGVMDSDGDGVMNYLDACPNTPANESVNLYGCACTLDLQYQCIPDKNFEKALIELGIDTEGVVNGRVAKANIYKVDVLDISRRGITDLSGIEGFKNLTDLRCWDNQLTSLDFSNNTSLELLSCGNNQLISLDVSQNTALTYLQCGGNQLTSLDVSNNTSLIELRCSGNQITNLNLGNNTSLEEIYCEYNQLTNLDLSKNTNLKGFLCGFNQLTSLNFGKNTNLIGGGCYFNQLTSLDVSQNTSLEYLACQGNQFTNLDVSFNTLSLGFDCRFMPLTCIKVNQSQLDNIPNVWIKDLEDFYALDCN